MASLFKPTITRRIGPDGKRCPAGTPGARKVVEKARMWYGKGIPGRKKPVPLSSDKRVAQAQLAELILAAERGEACLTPLERTKKTVLEWVEEWRDQLTARGLLARDVQQRANRVKRLVEGCGWNWPAEICNDGAERWLATYCEQEDLGPQTRNFYLEHIKSFAEWLVEKKTLGRNPFPARLRKLSVESDLRHARRSLTLPELTTLLETTRSSGYVTVRMTPEERYHLYLLTCAIGFRRGEMAALTPAHFKLDVNPPVVLLPARTGKNRHTVSQPLPLDIAEMFREWLRGKPRSTTLWHASLGKRSHHAIQRDLKTAGIPYVVDSPDGPLFADFHSLRHTYVSLLEAAGISLKQAMQLARHSDPRLTMARYGKVQLAELSASVQRIQLPGTQPAATAAESLLAWLLVVAGVAPVVALDVEAAGGKGSQPEQGGAKNYAA